MLVIQHIDNWIEIVAFVINQVSNRIEIAGGRMDCTHFVSFRFALDFFRCFRSLLRLVDQPV